MYMHKLINPKPHIVVLLGFMVKLECLDVWKKFGQQKKYRTFHIAT